MPVAAAAGPALGAVGSVAKIGLGLAGSSQQAAGYDQLAANRIEIADFNYDTEVRNARLTQLLTTAGIDLRESTQEAQKELAVAQAGLDFWEASAQAAAGRLNRQRIRKYGRIETALGRENIRRTAADFERQKSTTRADYAGAGVVGDVGSPLEVLAEQAGNMRMALNDLRYDVKLARAQRREAATFEGLQTKMIRIGARAKRDIDLQAAELIVEPRELADAAAVFANDQAVTGAGIARARAYNEAQGLQGQASATRTAGIGNAVGAGISALS